MGKLHQVSECWVLGVFYHYSEVDSIAGGLLQDELQDF